MPINKNIACLCVFASLWFALFVSEALATTPFYPSGVEMNGMRIGRHADYMEDYTKLTIINVRSAKFAPQFKPVNDDTFNYGGVVKDSIFWLRYKLVNPTRAKIRWILQEEHPSLKHVEVYEIRSNGEVRVHEGGTEIPFNTRDMAYRKNVFLMETEPGESEFYVKVWVRLTDRVGCTMTAWEPKAFMEKNNHENVAFGLFYVTLLAPLLYNLFVFFSSRDEVYLWFVAFIVAVFVSCLHDDGYVVQYIYSGFSSVPYLFFLGGWGTEIFVWSSFALAISFTRSFFRTKERAPSLEKMLRSFFLFYTAIALLLCGPYLFRFFLYVPIFIGLLAFPIILAYSGIRSLFAGVREAWFFLAAWIMPLVAALVLGRWIPKYSFLAALDIRVVPLAIIILFSFALMYRKKIMLLEKETGRV